MVFVFQLQAPFRPVQKPEESQSPQTAQEKFKKYDILGLRDVILNTLDPQERKAAAYEYASRVLADKKQREEAIMLLSGKAANIANFNPQYFLNKNSDGMYLLALAYKLAEGDFDLSSRVEDEIKSIGGLIKSRRVKGAPDSNQFVGSVKELADSIPPFPLPQVSQETQTQKEENKAVAGVGGESSNLTAEVKTPSNLQQQQNIEGSTEHNTGVIRFPVGDENVFRNDQNRSNMNMTVPNADSRLLSALNITSSQDEEDFRQKWDGWWYDFLLWKINGGQGLNRELSKRLFDMLNRGTFFADDTNHWKSNDEKDAAKTSLEKGDIDGFFNTVYNNKTNPLQVVFDSKFLIAPYTIISIKLIGKYTLFWNPSKKAWNARLDEGFGIYLNGIYAGVYQYNANLQAGVAALSLQQNNLFNLENKELANINRTYAEIIAGGSFLIYLGTGWPGIFINPIISFAPVPGIEIKNQDELKKTYPNIGDPKHFINETTSSKLGYGFFIYIVDPYTGIVIFPPQFGNLFVDGGVGFMKEAGGKLRFLGDLWERYKIDLSKGVVYYAFLVQVNLTGQIIVGQEPQYAIYLVPAWQVLGGTGWSANLNLKAGYNFNLRSAEVGVEGGVHGLSIPLLKNVLGNFGFSLGGKYNLGGTYNINNQSQTPLPKSQVYFRITFGGD